MVSRKKIIVLIVFFFLFSFFLFNLGNLKKSLGATSCVGVICGPNTYCIDGQCKCSAGTKNCDNNWENGCECGRSYTSCQENKCGCQPGFYDCDGDAYNGCESSKLCPVCTPATLRTCNILNICNGKQICGTDGHWGNCVRVVPQICTPYSISGCVPSIDGKKCPALDGSAKCNSCGSKYSTCTLSTDIACCPKTETSCEVGACTGTKSCAEDGKNWSACVSGEGITCCSQDTDCNDFNGCTTEKCINSKCEYNPVEDCRGLIPVKCKTDSNCASKDTCVNGSCLPLQCNSEFIIENHKCVCTGKECGGSCNFSQGICCNGKWNDDFDSCFFDLGYYKERVSLSLNKEAEKILGEAEALSLQGDLRKASVLAKIAISIAEVSLSTEKEILKNQATAFVNEAKILLANGNYSASLDKVDEALNLLSGKSVQTIKEAEPSFWQKNKIPIIVFSSIIIVLVLFISYVIIVPKI